MKWNEKVVLVTGGTGSFGKKFIEVMLQRLSPGRKLSFTAGTN